MYFSCIVSFLGGEPSLSASRPLLPLRASDVNLPVGSVLSPPSVASRLWLTLSGCLSNVVLSCIRGYRVVTPFTRSKLGAADAQGPSSDVGREAEATSRAPILIEGYCNECKQGLWGLHIDAPCLTGRDVPFTPAPPRPSSFGSIGYTIRSYDDSDSQDDSDTLLDEPGPLPTVFHHKHDIKYTFHFRLGEGATGRVMLAHAVYPGDSEEHQVAIKVFSKGHAIDRGRQALTVWNMESNEQRRKLMISMIPRSDVINSETNLLKGFYDTEHQSPFLTPLLAAFQDEKNVYLVMRMYPDTLDRRLRRLAEDEQKLSVEEIRLYAAELFCALKTLHQKHHIVHCDIKPQNLLISPSGHLCLADFGLSKKFRANNFESLRRPKAGTVGYIPPETFVPGFTTVLGTALDIWGLGVLLLEMFEGTGQPHFAEIAMDGNPVVAPDVFDIVSDVEAADLIDSIVNKDSASRLKLSAIEEHAFFSDVDWTKVESRQYKPLYCPGPPTPIDPNSSVSFSTHVLDFELDCDIDNDIDNDIAKFSKSLCVDYLIPASARFDPSH